MKINNKEIKKVEPVKQPVLETPPVVKPQEEKKCKNTYLFENYD